VFITRVYQEWVTGGHRPRQHVACDAPLGFPTDKADRLLSPCVRERDSLKDQRLPNEMTYIGTFAAFQAQCGIDPAAASDGGLQLKRQIKRRLWHPRSARASIIRTAELEQVKKLDCRRIIIRRRAAFGVSALQGSRLTPCQLSTMRGKKTGNPSHSGQISSFFPPCRRSAGRTSSNFIS
jgi:hypothetical protein